MKVTICFDDVKVIVPCVKVSTNTTMTNEEYLKVSDVILNAVSRYKKATGKTNNCLINVVKLQTVRDGGILDPDDFIQEVVEDKEILIAIYEEYLNGILLSSNNNQTMSSISSTLNNNINNSNMLDHTTTTKSNSLNNSSISNASTISTNGSYAGNSIYNPNNATNTIQRVSTANSTSNNRNSTLLQNQVVVTQNDFANTNSTSNQSNLKVKSGSESCIYKSLNDYLNQTKNVNNPTSTTTTNNTTNKMPTTTTTEMDNKNSYFNRVSSNRQSVVKNENQQWSTGLNYASATSYSNNGSNINLTSEQIFTISLPIDPSHPGPLGIHVIPSFDANTQREMGLIVQKVEPGGKVAQDGRMRDGDRILEINRNSLIGVDFLRAQDILRDAIRLSSQTHSLEFKLFRLFSNIEVSHLENEDDLLMIDDEIPAERAIGVENENKENEQNSSLTPNEVSNSNNTNINLLNTKKLGKKIAVQLVKGPQGLGFKLAARDNCNPGEYSPIYIKSILPKGAAVTDGRLQRGDRLLEVNRADMTVKSLHEAVNVLRNTKLGSTVEIVVSRQMLPGSSNNTQSTVSSTLLPREMDEPAESNGLSFQNHNDEETNQPDSTQNQTSEMDEKMPEKPKPKKPKRELLTFEIAFNDTGSAGLGVSVKGKTKRLDDSECSIDLGIFVKTVINGGAASKDGRLRPNDQLININGFSLLGKSNEEAMLILRDAMQYESNPGFIELTVSRKCKLDQSVKTLENDEEEEMENNNNNNQKQEMFITSPEKRSPNKQIVKVVKHGENVVAASTTSRERNREQNTNSRFNRDAPARRSMSEKRTKLGHVPSHLASIKQAGIVDKMANHLSGSNNVQVTRRSQTANILHAENSSSTDIPIQIEKKSELQSAAIKDDIFNRIGSFESVVNRANVISNEPCGQNGAYNNSQNYTQTNVSNFCTINRKDRSKHGQFYQQQPNYQQTYAPPQYNHNQQQQQQVVQPARRSISMESIPSNVAPQETQISNNQARVEKIHHINNNANMYQKFGTVSGYTQHSRPGIDAQNTFSSPTKTNDVLAVEAAAAAQALANNRMRAVNRSFRTAVDKSFDVNGGHNSNNNEKDMADYKRQQQQQPATRIQSFKQKEAQNTPNVAKTNNQEIPELSRKKSKEGHGHRKGIIGTFQNLFKHSSNTSSKSGEKKSDTSQSSTPSSKPSVELLNYNKRTSDVVFDQAQQSVVPNKNNKFQVLSNNAPVINTRF